MLKNDQTLVNFCRCKIIVDVANKTYNVLTFSFTVLSIAIKLSFFVSHLKAVMYKKRHYSNKVCLNIIFFFENVIDVWTVIE